MLKSLFTSNARVKLLNLFLDNLESEFFVRELTRILSEQINSVRRELENLKNMGMLVSRTKSRKKYYRVNPDFIILPELVSLFKKVRGGEETSRQDQLTDKISSLGEISVLVYTGAFIGKQSEADLLIVGDNLKKDAIAEVLDTEREEGEPIRYATLTTEDFLYRHKYNDRFITDIISRPENIIAINKLKDQIRLDF